MGGYFLKQPKIKFQNNIELSNLLGIEAYSFLLKLDSNKDLLNSYLGKWTFFSEGITSKCIVIDNSASSSEVMEIHQKNLDLHITLTGNDTIFLGEEIVGTLKEYDLESDYSLVNVKHYVEKLIPEGHFLIIEPNQPHVNILNLGSLKLVYKINSRTCQE